MPSIAPELLAILRCPKCKGALRSPDAAQLSLECAACRLRYPVRDGIPILLIDEATPA
ncbi:MAG: Trm112 family protein [Gemmatimonadota bacterium]